MELSLQPAAQDWFMQSIRSFMTTMTWLEFKEQFLRFFCPSSTRELLADLVMFDVIDFDVILGMDWLAQHYASLDCREKVVIFQNPQ